MTAPLETLVPIEPIVRLVADHPNDGPRFRALPNVVSVLGADAGCDVVLTSGRVEDVHAAIARLHSGTYLCDLGALSGTSLNRRRIRWSRLAAGDTIGVGPFEFGVELADRPDAVMSGLPVFSLRNDREIGLVSSIDPVLIVGSDPGCDIVLPSRSVLPRHCIVIWTEEGPLVRDLLRRNLTRLNGKRINMGRVMNGDAIGVGPYEFYFETEIDARGAGRRPGRPITASKRMGDEAVLVAGRLPLEQVERARDLWRGPEVAAESESVIMRDRPIDAEPAVEAHEPFLIESADSASRQAGGHCVAIDEGVITEAEHAEQAELLAALEASLDHEASEPLPDVETLDSEPLPEADSTVSEPTAPATTEHTAREPIDQNADEITTSSAESPAAPDVVEDVSTHKEITMANDSEAASANVSSEKPSMQELIHKRAERLDSKTGELRQRVAAAQAALDERASKHRARLDEERRRLEQRRNDLQRQAKALLHASGGQRPSGMTEGMCATPACWHPFS